MPTPKQAYAAKLTEIAARYGRIEDDVARRAVAMLADLRRQIAAELNLAQGMIECQAPAGLDTAMHVVTPQARTSVHDAAVTVTTGPGVTRLAVTDGEAELDSLNNFNSEKIEKEDIF